MAQCRAETAEPLPGSPEAVKLYAQRASHNQPLQPVRRAADDDSRAILPASSRSGKNACLKERRTIRTGTTGPLPVSLGARLLLFRRQAGLSQHALARAAGVDESLIRWLQQGRKANPRIDTLQKLAGALGLTLRELTESAEVRAG
jgi:ribosome-binding protein aMBF1 (putative translation factor)